MAKKPTPTAKPAPRLKGPPKKRGAPKAGESKRTPETIQAILDALSIGTPMAEICRRPEMPSIMTVDRWQKDDPDLKLAIARARDLGFDEIAMDAMRIIDAEPERIVTMSGDDETEGRIDSAGVARAKNRAWLRLQLLAKWDPKRYGDRMIHAGDESAPMAITINKEDAEL